MQPETELASNAQCNWAQFIFQVEEPCALATCDTPPPNDNDVILGRGKRNQLHPGNIWFHAQIEEKLASYNEAGRGKKGEIVRSTVASLPLKRNGRFLLMIPWGGWKEASNEVVVAKVAQAFRHRRRVLARGLPSKRRREENRKMACPADTAKSAATNDRSETVSPMEVRSLGKVEQTGKETSTNALTLSAPMDTKSQKHSSCYHGDFSGHRRKHNLSPAAGNIQCIPSLQITYGGKLQSDEDDALMAGDRSESSNAVVTACKPKSRGTHVIRGGDGREILDEFDWFDDVSESSNSPQLLSDREIMEGLGFLGT